ncbi:MAG: hypothetical protein S0880_30410, partial [Actinomycetota bacterium]|nr:hypothetical protein [Actinomycetota bacterium]
MLVVLVDEALYRTGRVDGLPSGRSFADGDQTYDRSFWALPHWAEHGGYFQVPFMPGAGGNTVLAPNGASTFVLTDHGEDTYSLASPGVAEAIRPFPELGLDGVELIPRVAGRRRGGGVRGRPRAAAHRCVVLAPAPSRPDTGARGERVERTVDDLRHWWRRSGRLPRSP